MQSAGARFEAECQQQQRRVQWVRTGVGGSTQAGLELFRSYLRQVQYIIGNAGADCPGQGFVHLEYTAVVATRSATAAQLFPQIASAFPGGRSRSHRS